MNRFNKRQFLWFITLYGFAILIAYLLYTGRIYTFVHPKMVKYVTASLLGFLILSVYQFFQIFTISRNSGLKPGYILFMIPIILGFTAKGFDASILEKKSVSLAAQSSKSPQGDNSLKNNATSLVAVPNNQAIAIPESYFTEEGIIQFKDTNFFRALNDIGSKLEQFKGRKVDITGFVYKDKGLKSNEFVISRMMMSCCAADAQLVGLACTGEEAAAMSEGEWVRVQGTIGSGHYKNPDTGEEQEIAIIYSEKTQRNQPPGSQYIYP